MGEVKINKRFYIFLGIIILLIAGSIYYYTQKDNVQLQQNNVKTESVKEINESFPSPQIRADKENSLEALDKEYENVSKKVQEQETHKNAKKTETTSVKKEKKESNSHDNEEEKPAFYNMSK